MRARHWYGKLLPGLLLLTLALLGCPSSDGPPKPDAPKPDGPPEPRYPISTYKTNASEAYGKLKDFYGPNPPVGYNYWQLGNVLDTMVDYLRQSEMDPGDFLTQTVLTTYDKIQNAGCWYDDFGWWGITSAKAYDSSYDSVFGSSKQAYQQIAQHTWQVMHVGKCKEKDPQARQACVKRHTQGGVYYKYEGAPNAWENRNNGVDQPPYFTTAEHWAKPRFDKGVWQFDLYHESRPESCSALAASVDPADPTLEGIKLGPYQDSVVNGLYMVLSQRMHGHADGADQAANDQYEFLTHWFFLKDGAEPDCDHALLNQKTCPGEPGHALMRERVSTYAYCKDCSVPYPPVQAYNKDVAWTGDQGLMIGGMIDRYLLNPDDTTSRDVAKWLTEGVASRLTKNNVVQATSRTWTAGDLGDYESGEGIFWRYLLYAYQKDATIRSVVDQEDFLKVVRASADAAVDETPGASSLFDHFNILSTLTTAIYILEHQD